MSRIEEALRRASVPRIRTASAVEDLPDTPNGESSLTRYPAEFRGEAVPESRPHPVTFRSADGHYAKPAERPGPFPEAIRSKLIVGDAPPLAVEQYRRLGGTLHELQVLHGTKILLVASAVPCEGKTLTVTNLALTLSETYQRRVLLIDADLRRPSVHQIFQMPNARGLCDGLDSAAGEIPVLQASPRLSVLPAGRAGANPLAALTSARMRTLLDQSAAAFDWVLLDAPPIGFMPDANLLVRLTQGVIFVIAAGSTPYAVVNRAVAEIGRENIVGTVLNQVDADRIPDVHYYDHYYGHSERLS